MSEPIYVVRFPGMYRRDDFDKIRERFMDVNGDVLGDKVVFVDASVEDVFELDKQDVGKLVEVLASAAGYEVVRLEGE